MEVIYKLLKLRVKFFKKSQNIWIANKYQLESKLFSQNAKFSSKQKEKQILISNFERTKNGLRDRTKFNANWVSKRDKK